MRTVEERQRVIGEIWAEVLEVRIPEPDDRFFALGGDSITCVRFVAMARQHGLGLSLRDVLLDDELASLASRAHVEEEVS